MTLTNKLHENIHRSAFNLQYSTNDGYTDFQQIFKEMGISDRWILTPGNSDSEIRQAFQVFSQSAVRVSQGATGLGGFGNPK
ncbi:hypothetical protein [Synechococcus sp. PCC 7502]|uniref:hypothetical protein n=1 Tax=Synechococcus sp. PCC 7502 TaxID=1173263 RepID=UPI00030F9306|nr:hypothetical protein [Synechococcus sp. PCC 7502]